ncbi:MAG: antitoxin Xre/MbcA/ParS toxin-binding domain-containing protein [Gemmatimonadaceae bacterium]
MHSIPATSAKSAAPLPAPTLSKAVIRAADLLGLNQALVSEILGVSRASASRLVAGKYLLDQSRGKEWELALLFVRLFRSLDAVAGHGAQARAWLAGNNVALGATPLELVRTAEGLVRVVQYLDAARGRV